MGDSADSDKKPDEESAAEEESNEVREDDSPEAAGAAEDDPEARVDTESPHAKDDDNDGTGEETEEEEEDGMDVDDPAEDENAEDGKEVDEPNAESHEHVREIKTPTFDEEATKNVETSYSTRGRTGETALDILAESSQREADAQLPRDKEAVPTLGPSFLSDSLTEEERRTRTRYIPNVEGMNMLRKQEIKGDLALARCMTTSAGVATTIAKKARRGREDDMDAGDAVPPSDEDKASEILRLGTRTLEVGDLEYIFPSSAFLAPTISGPSNGDAKSAKPNPPNVVEAVAAFNPPRPPESVGPKKKHRMLRWERRPADIEVDLNTYRKTVQKTREELQKAMLERDRIQMLDNHLRRHFLNHLECLNEEFSLICEETTKVQQACISSSELITSRTRSRGAGKSNYVMRDVLSVLRARGAELKERGIKLDPPLTASEGNPRGVGGVGGESFKLCPDTQQTRQRKLCVGWAAPGDKVSTPYGKGEVIKVLPHGKLDPSDEAPDGIIYKPNKDGDAEMIDVDRSGVHESVHEEGSKESESDRLVAPRIAVRLPFGMGFFPPETVEPIEDIASFSDSRLARRWQGLIETAPMFGEVLDFEGMMQHMPTKNSLAEPANPAGGNALVNNGATGRCEPGLAHKNRLLAFGSDLIPTFVGRGALLSGTDISELDQVLDRGFFRSACILSRPNNKGVPASVRESEDKQHQRFLMKAKLRQLKNEINRQRRIRQLNQRTFTAAQERAARIESLVAEMRTDLGSLKRRLDEEVHSLGINDEEAERILISYYNRDEPGNGEESPFQRSRQMDLDSEDEDGYDDDAVPTQEVSI